MSSCLRSFYAEFDTEAITEQTKKGISLSKAERRKINENYETGHISLAPEKKIQNDQEIIFSKELLAKFGSILACEQAVNSVKMVPNDVYPRMIIVVSFRCQWHTFFNLF